MLKIKVFQSYHDRSELRRIRLLLPLLAHVRTYIQSCRPSSRSGGSFGSNNGKIFHGVSFERFIQSQLQDQVADQMNDVPRVTE